MSYQSETYRAQCARREREETRARRIDFWLQGAIFATTIVSMWFITAPGLAMKWGYIVALGAQPLWLLATWRAKQTGMFLCALLVYTPLWARGVVNFFF
jgi:hypothetical protein